MDAAPSDSSANPAHPSGHPDNSVLRSYLAGVLAGDERLRLVEHLRDCADCRSALEDLRAQFATAIIEPGALGGAAGRPPGRVTSAMTSGMTPGVAPARPAQGVPAPAMPARPPTSSIKPPVPARAAGLRLPYWLVAALLLVILVETAALIRGVPVRIDDSTARRPQIGASPAAVDAAPRIKVVFVGSASDQAIRALLRTVHGRIVDGPAPDGAYVVEIRPAPTPGGETPLQILRNRVDLVKQVGAGPEDDGR